MKMFSLIALAALAVSVPVKAQLPTSVAPIASPALAGNWLVASREVTATRIGITTSNVAGYFMVFDSATVVPDGAVTPLFCRPVAVSTNISLVFPTPARFYKGLVLALSTSGCYTKTASATAYFEASIR